MIPSKSGCKNNTIFNTSYLNYKKKQLIFDKIFFSQKAGANIYSFITHAKKSKEIYFYSFSKPINRIKLTHKQSVREENIL